VPQQIGSRSLAQHRREVVEDLLMHRPFLLFSTSHLRLAFTEQAQREPLSGAEQKILESWAELYGGSESRSIEKFFCCHQV
jgi:hypothetical protein